MTRLVLAGGGHAHAFVLRALAEAPLEGARVTLVTPHGRHTYSGMLPGFVAGHYALGEIQIDLAALAARAGIELVRDEVVALDAARRVLRLGSGAELGYDVAALNLGSLPATRVPGSAGHAIAAVPFERFIEQWQPGARKVAVVGGGAAGVELAMAVAHRSGARVSLYSDRPMFRAGLWRRIARRLERYRIRLLADTAVEAVEKGPVVVARAAREPFDAVLWSAGAAALPWLAASGLAIDARGFVQVDATLRSTSHPEVFAAGDCATLAGAPHPKSGVYAVRHGAVLERNLRARLAGAPLERYAPQRRALALLSCGARYAIADWDGWSAEGAWAWRWKDRLDRRWVERFRA